MSEWKTQQMVCVLNYQPVMEIGRYTEEFKRNIHSRFGHIDLTKPQQFGPVQMMNYSYNFKHHGQNYTMNMTPESLTIIRELEKDAPLEIFKDAVDTYLKNVLYIWGEFKRIVKLFSLTRAGMVSVFNGESNEICIKEDGRWNGFYHADRKFKFDIINLPNEQDGIEVVDNLFYDYENDMETLRPIYPKRIIDIALVPKSNGVVGRDQVADLLQSMKERLVACYDRMFDV